MPHCSSPPSVSSYLYPSCFFLTSLLLHCLLFLPSCSLFFCNSPCYSAFLSSRYITSVLLPPIECCFALCFLSSPFIYLGITSRLLWATVNGLTVPFLLFHCLLRLPHSLADRVPISPSFTSRLLPFSPHSSVRILGTRGNELEFLPSQYFFFLFFLYSFFFIFLLFSFLLGSPWL